MFEQFVQEHDASFKLPKMTALEPEVWEHVERLITGNGKISKCRCCAKKFECLRGELVCSEKCRKKQQAEHKGFVCAACAKPILPSFPAL